MKTDISMNSVCTDKGILEQYQHYLDSGDKQGQQRLLHRIRRTQTEALRNDRKKLACLDYIIARIEKTDQLSENEQRILIL